MTRVVLAEDALMIRAAIARLLRDGGCEVVAEVASCFMPGTAEGA